MDAKRVISELKQKYPGKAIFPNDKENPTEIICEVEPASEHPDWSLAVAVIDKSVQHFHLKTTEEYTVTKGELVITVDGEEYNLSEGQSYVIRPPQHHFANGNETWVECKSTPGWRFDDHIVGE